VQERTFGVERTVVIAAPLDDEVADVVPAVVVDDPAAETVVATEVDEVAGFELPLHPARANAQITMARLVLTTCHPMSESKVNTPTRQRLPQPSCPPHRATSNLATVPDTIVAIRLVYRPSVVARPYPDASSQSEDSSRPGADIPAVAPARCTRTPTSCTVHSARRTCQALQWLRRNGRVNAREEARHLTPQDSSPRTLRTVPEDLPR